MTRMLPFRIRKVTLTFLIVLLIIILTLFLVRKQKSESFAVANSSQLRDQDDYYSKRLAVIVPFRDRFDELLTFVPYLTQFIRAQNIRAFSLYIVNQSSRYRFNRGALANVGYQLCKDQSDYIAIHDVDLLPENKNLSYVYPEDGPYHLSSPEYHPLYNYHSYFGGILLITNNHFEQVNGFSNRYFGWGLEDDEFLTRVKAANLPVFRPKNLTTNKTNTFLHIHYQRKRDTFRTKEQKDILRRPDKATGLRDVKYSVNSKHNLIIDGEKCSVFNVELYCDIKRTPWCQHKTKSTEHVD